MGGYAASRGVPQAKLATLASGVLIIVGGLLVLLGLWLDLGALLLRRAGQADGDGPVPEGP